MKKELSIQVRMKCHSHHKLTMDASVRSVGEHLHHNLHQYIQYYGHEKSARKLFLVIIKFVFDVHRAAMHSKFIGSDMTDFKIQ
jgi:hypothetical protein